MAETTDITEWSNGDVIFTDITEYAESLQSVWALDFQQLTHAEGKGGCRFVTDGRSLLYHELYPAMIGLHGALSENAISFVLTNDRGQSGKWEGGSHPPESIAHAVSERELDVVLPCGTTNLAAILPLDEFREEFEQLSGQSCDWLTSENDLFLRVEPAARIWLERMWLGWVESRCFRGSLARPVVESLVRVCTPWRTRRGGSGPSSRTLFRRAIHLLHEDERISYPSDLALGLGVGLRSLELVFHDCAGMPPVRYMRRLRLNRVHSALLAASPKETSVGAVALDHGFSELGRFAGEYRRLFGELPSATLAKAGGRPVVSLPRVH